MAGEGPTVMKKIACPPRLDQQTGQALLETVREQPLVEGDAVVLDLSGTTEMDARGGAWLVAIADRWRSARANCVAKATPAPSPSSST